MMNHRGKLVRRGSSLKMECFNYNIRTFTQLQVLFVWAVTHLKGTKVEFMIVSRLYRVNKKKRKIR